VQCFPRRRRRARRRAVFLALTLCLLTLHCEPGSDERRAVIYTLKAEPTEEHLLEIRDLLSDTDRDVRATALNALVGLGVPDAADLAVRGLDDPDGFVRATAAKLVADVGDPGLADVLVGPLLEDPDPIARQRAAEALARFGGPAALDALNRALADPMERVRRAAVSGLIDLDPAHAVDELARLLREDPAWEIRAQAAHALGLTGDPAVLPDLEAGLGDANEFVRSAVTNAIKLHGQTREKTE